MLLQDTSSEFSTSAHSGSEAADVVIIRDVRRAASINYHNDDQIGVQMPKT